MGAINPKVEVTKPKEDDPLLEQNQGVHEEPTVELLMEQPLPVISSAPDIPNLVTSPKTCNSTFL